MMGETIGLLLLTLACVLAVLMTVVRLPGTWLIVFSAALFGWWTNWVEVTGLLIGVLIGLAMVSEAVEMGMSAVTARRVGGSRRAMWGGVVGGLVGMLFLSSLFSVPLPLIGTLIGAALGAMAGCFAGSLIGELSTGREFSHGTKVGFSATLGFALGTATKTAFSLAMSGILLASAFLKEAS